MSDSTWNPGTLLCRGVLETGPAMLLYTPRTGEARTATVDGRDFSDLPELLEAADGDFTRVRMGNTVAVKETELSSPVARPRKIVCVGQNYQAHIKEGGRTAPPAHPDLFAKWDNALAGPYDSLSLPPESDQIDYESELAVVIGRRCRRVPADAVAGVVFGYTIANDGSVRDYQFHTAQRTAGKAWDGLTPVGPGVVPAAHLGGVEPDLRVTGLLNGEVMQDDRTTSMVYGVVDLITYISTFMTLEPGDLILTGTPAGVGIVRNPPRFLSDGDEFEVRVEGIGSLRNMFRAEQPQ